MCLRVKKGCRPEIAKKDITTWKYVVDTFNVNRSWKPVFRGGYLPYDEPVTAEEWNERCDRVPVSKLHVREYASVKYGEIFTGFHSLRNLWGVFNMLGVLGHMRQYSLKWCIIPKGAEYCKGTHGEIVSTGIIVFRSFSNYLNHKRTK